MAKTQTPAAAETPENAFENPRTYAPELSQDDMHWLMSALFEGAQASQDRGHDASARRFWRLREELADHMAENE